MIIVLRRINNRLGIRGDYSTGLLFTFTRVQVRCASRYLSNFCRYLWNDTHLTPFHFPGHGNICIVFALETDQCVFMMAAENGSRLSGWHRVETDSTYFWVGVWSTGGSYLVPFWDSNYGFSEVWRIGRSCPLTDCGLPVDGRWLTMEWNCPSIDIWLPVAFAIWLPAAWHLIVRWISIDARWPDCRLVVDAPCP